ncbi:MAG: YIP1 family protein [Pseudomonadota bacterium]
MSVTDTGYGQGPLPEVTLADLDEDPEIVRLRQESLSARIRMSIVDMRKATRLLLDDNPSEQRLLFFVLLSDIIFFLNFGVKFVVAPPEDVNSGMPANFAEMIGGIIVICFLLRTATLYLFSGIVALFSRLLGGRGSWRDTRAGIFWASLVAAPVGVVGALIVVGLGYLEPHIPLAGSQLVQMPAQLIGVVAFVYFVSAAVAEAQQFKRTSPLFITFSVLSVALLIGGLLVVDMARSALA